MMIAKISPLLPLLPPPRRVFYAVVSTIYIQFFCGDKIMDTKIGGGFLLEGIFHTWKNFAQTRTIAAKSFKKQELVLLLLYFRVGDIGVIICLFIDQLCFRFQLFDFQSHASPNLRILRISAPPQQLFVFIQAFLRRLFRELRVLVEIRRPFALQRGFYFVSRVGEERVDVSLERRPLLRGDETKKRETRPRCSKTRRPTLEAPREEEEDARARRLLSFSFTWSDRSSISKGQIETEKDAIEVADRAQTYTQRRRRRRIIICCGKTVNATRCHIVSFKTKNFDEKLPFVQSSSRVFETKKKDRRDAPPEREPLSVLVLKSDDPQIRSRVLRRRLTQPMRCVCNFL